MFVLGMYLCMARESNWDCTVVVIVAETTTFGFAKKTARYLLQEIVLKNAKNRRSQQAPPFIYIYINVCIHIYIDNRNRIGGSGQELNPVRIFRRRRNVFFFVGRTLQSLLRPGMVSEPLAAHPIAVW